MSGASPKGDRAGGLRPEPQASQPEALIPCAWLEHRPDHRGEFDELVAKFADGMMVAEMMDDNGIHIGLYWDDGRYCDWWLTSKKPLRNTTDHGVSDAPRYTAAGVDRMPWLPDYSAQAIEARRAETQSGSVHESAVATPCAQKGAA